MKFCLVVPQEFAEHYRAMPFEISGLLNWARVFDGEIRIINEDISGFDVYMTNISSTETEYVNIIRQVEPDAQIVACFDYGFDVVNQYFSNMARVKEVLMRCDRVFSVNKNQTEWMRLLLPDKEIHYVPHPSDVEHIIQYYKPREKRDLGIGAMWHQYDNYQIQSLEVLKAVERVLKRPLRKILLGAKGRLMVERGVIVQAAEVPVVGDDGPPDLRGKPIDPYMEKYVQISARGVGWDSVLPYVGVGPWYDFLSRLELCLDLYTVNSIGRFGIDCAAVGVPCVASSRQDSAHVLWPMTTVDPYSPDLIVRTLTKLFRDPAYYDRVERAAMKSLDYYSFGRSKERMLRVLA